MKEKVLTNILDFIIENNIDGQDHVKNWLQSFVNEDRPLVELLDEDFDNSHVIWAESKTFLKFNKTSIMLIENFSEAVNNENYLLASSMKEYILNDWDFDEEKLLSECKEFIGELIYFSDEYNFNFDLHNKINYVKTKLEESGFKSIPEFSGELDNIKNGVIDSIKDKNIIIDFDITKLDSYIFILHMLNV